MSKRIFMTMLILIGSITFTGCSETAFMSSEKRAEYDAQQAENRRIRLEQEAERKRLRAKEIRQATGGECDAEPCYAEYKLRVSFEVTCQNYGHRKSTAAFNQCVGMERNNYERQQQLEQMEREARSRDAAAREDARRKHNKAVLRDAFRSNNKKPCFIQGENSRRLLC